MKRTKLISGIESWFRRSLPVTAIAIFVLWFCVSFTVSAEAYVLRGPHILDLVAKKLNNSGGADIAQTLILFDTENTNLPIELSETLYYSFPYAFRAETRSDHADRIHVHVGGKTLTAVGGGLTNDSPYDSYKDILLYNNRVLLEERLTAQGIDVSVSSLGRLEDRIVYVVGAQYPDESTPQLWIDKETFFPVRWILVGRDPALEEDSLEVRFWGWQKADKIQYPRRIEFYRNDRLVREIRVERIAYAPSLPAELFDIERIRAEYRETVPPGKDDASAGEVEKTIDEFRKLYQ